MKLQNDSQGFLIGERRLAELNDGVNNVHADTAEILQLLKAQLGAMANHQTHQKWQTNKLNDSILVAMKTRPTVNVSLGSYEATKPTRKTGVTGNKAERDSSTTSRPVNGATKTTSKGAVPDHSANTALGTKPKDTSSTTTVSGRDSQGRFTGSAKTVNEKAFNAILNGGIRSGGGIGADVGGIDPTVDAVRELGSLLSPAKGAFRLMGRGAMWLYKRSKPKRSEELPKDQQDHNTEVERNNTETRKLFRKLIDAINRKRSAAGGLLGGLGIPGRGGKNGRNGGPVPAPVPGKGKGKGGPVPIPGKDAAKNGPNGGKLGKVFGGLGRKLPLVGAVVGGGVLASQWGDMGAAEKGGGIGSVVGGGLGGLAGSLLGPVGAVAGVTIGSVIGDSVGSKIGSWAESLKGQDIGGTIVKGWNKTLANINDMVTDGWKGLGSYGSNMSGYGAAGGGFMLASFGRRNSMGGSGGGYGGGYGGGSSGGTPSDYNPNNEVPIKRVLEAGKGYNIVELADGSVIRQDGNWNWRNRNAGNIEDGDFAKSSGRVDQSTAAGTRSTKRFAAFPTLAAGRKAKEKLIFDSENYRNLNLMGAIHRYAPPKENNTAAYQKHVLAAVGANKRMSDYSSAERQIILNAIQQKEGSLKEGKVTVIKPPTKNTNPARTPPKAITVSAPLARPASKPMLVSHYPKLAPAVEMEKPNALRRVSSKQEQPVMMASSNRDSISQIPADRDIAHAITGGLGMRSQIA